MRARAPRRVALAAALISSCGGLEAPTLDAGSDPIEEPTLELVETPRLPIEPAEEIESPRLEAFLGEPDAPRLEALRSAPIARIVRGFGGRSVAFRVFFEDGSAGYWKPEQTISSTDFRAEILAYHLDRALGLGRVPPVVMRSISLGRLEAVMQAQDAGRIGEIVAQEDGSVRGAMVWWIPERLPELTLGRSWERWVRVGPAPTITPFQRARIYAAQASGEIPVDGAPDDARPLAEEPDVAARPGELSDLVVFDYLAHNIDRWGGGFANLRTRERGGPLVFLDQGAGFVPHRARFGYMDARLTAVQRFRRATIEALGRLDADDVVARAVADGVPVDPRTAAHLEERRQVVLAHVDAMIERFGERVWLD